MTPSWPSDDHFKLIMSLKPKRKRFDLGYGDCAHWHPQSNSYIKHQPFLEWKSFLQLLAALWQLVAPRTDPVIPMGLAGLFKNFLLKNNHSEGQWWGSETKSIKIKKKWWWGWEDEEDCIENRLHWDEFPQFPVEWVSTSAKIEKLYYPLSNWQIA